MSKYYRREAKVRKILSEQLKINIVKKKLVYAHDKEGLPKMHEFDLVANTENGLLVGEVKSSAYASGGSSGYRNTNFWRVLGACILLEKVEASRKILVLTDRELYEHFKVDSEGLISEDIEIMLVDVGLA